MITAGRRLSSLASKDKKLKKDIKEFEKLSDNGDINALEKVSSLIKLNIKESGKVSRNIDNIQGMKAVKKIASVNPYGRAAILVSRAISSCSQMIQMSEDIKELTRTPDSLIAFKEWPTIYDFIMIDKVMQTILDEEEDEALLGLPTLLINLTYKETYENLEGVAADFIYYLDTGVNKAKVQTLLSNASEEANDEWNTINFLIDSYNHTEELHRAMEEVESIILELRDAGEDTNDLKLFKTMYDLLYIESNPAEVAELYKRTYFDLMHEDDILENKSFSELIRTIDTRDLGYLSGYIMIAPIAPFDIHIMGNPSYQVGPRLLKAFSIANSKQRDLQRLSDDEKGIILDAFNSYYRSDIDSILMRRIIKDIEKMTNRILSNM